MITELIEFELRKEVSKDQLIKQVDTIVNDFHKNQDGYVDIELVSSNTSRLGQMIVHYQTMQDIEKVKNNIPHSSAVKEFSELVIPGSVKVSFYEQQEKWSA